MTKPERVWQLISMLFAVALVAALAALHQATPYAAAPSGTLPTVIYTNATTDFALSPAARRVFERYSL